LDLLAISVEMFIPAARLFAKVVVLVSLPDTAVPLGAAVAIWTSGVRFGMRRSVELLDALEGSIKLLSCLAVVVSLHETLVEGKWIAGGLA
jgi:hypothetical protein